MDNSAVMPDPGGRASPEAGEARAAKVLFGKYEVGRLLGCGATAKVYHGRNVKSGQSVAIKCISKARAAKGGVAPDVIKREVAIMRRLRHPHILRLLEVLASRTKIYFVLELAKGGELFARLAARGRVPEDQARRYFHQLVSAVGYCHSRGVFHRDLKPENLLLDDAGDLKVSDFGLSALLPRGNGLLHTLCGTPAYVAPEILAKKAYAGAAVDVWSCGVILFVLNAGYLPFNDPNLMSMYRRIYRGEYRCPKWTSPELRRLIARLLDTNPETRITVDGILHDPWFRKGLDEEKWAAMMRFHDDDDDKISKAAEEEERNLNAFDLISFSSGFDLSGLFDSAADRERFVSAGPAEEILSRVEEVGKEEGMTVRRMGKKGLGGAVLLEQWNGNPVARVEIHRLTEGLVVVEVEVEKDGWERRNEEFWREKLRPALTGPAASSATPVENLPDPLA